jgi:hypothetical protein
MIGPGLLDGTGRVFICKYLPNPTKSVILEFKIYSNIYIYIYTHTSQSTMIGYDFYISYK